MSELVDRPIDRDRYRTPLGLTVIGYKVLFGLGELVVGLTFAIPSINVNQLFARLSAEELREDPSDRFVALVSRSLPTLLQHRVLVAVALLVLGTAKLIAAGAMWEGKEWGRYLLLAVVAAALPLDVLQAAIDPTILHVGLVVANAAVVLVLLLFK